MAAILNIVGHIEPYQPGSKLLLKPTIIIYNYAKLYTGQIHFIFVIFMAEYIVYL